MRATLVSAVWRVLVLVLGLAGLSAAPALGAGPVSESPPLVAGVAEVGRTLTASSDSWAGTAPRQYTYRWQRCDGTLYADEVLRDGPTAYYRLGDSAESATVTDATGGENLGTFRNGVLQELDGGLFEDGDGAVGFDGADDDLEVPDAAGLDLGDALTLEAWIRPGGADPAAILDKGPGAYALRLTGDGRFSLVRSGFGDVATATAAIPLDDVFHHVVATKSGSEARLYLDGADVTGTTARHTLADGASALRIGSAHAPTAGEDPYRGELDEVALYRGALSAARVRAHYDVGSSGCVPVAGAQGAGYAVVPADHGATMRVLVTATDAAGSTTVASEQSAVVATQAPVPLETPVAWGDPVVGERLVAGEGVWAGGGALTYSFQWQSCLDRRYRAAVLADSPRGYWRLGEPSGAGANDDSARGNRGTYANGVALRVTGALEGSADTNGGARFDGADDHVSVPDRASLDLGDSLTIEAWVRRDASGVAGHIVQKGNGGYGLRVGADERVTLVKSSVKDLARSGMAISADGAYHHVVAAKSGATARVYVDGVDVTVPVGSATIVDTSAPLQIGRHRNSQTGAVLSYLSGDLDEVAVYDTALPAARVRAHFEAGTSGCASIGGATDSEYVPAPEDAGKRLRVLVTAGNESGSAAAPSARTAAVASSSEQPLLAAGVVTDVAGNPVPGATVSIHLWPAEADVPVGGSAATTLVGQTTSDAAGNYALEAAPATELEAEAAANDGVVNLELRVSGRGLQHSSFIERNFGSPDAEAHAAGGEALAEAESTAVWQDSTVGLPALPAAVVLDAREPAVASLQADPPGSGVECSNWDKIFGIWKKTGQGEAYTRVGELHTWSSMTNRVAYGTRADSNIDVAFKTPTSKWFLNGYVHVGNSTGRSTAAGQTAKTGPGEYTSRAVAARFVYTHWYQCGTGNKKSRAVRWNGLNLKKGGWVSSRDGECSALEYHVFDAGQDWTRDSHRAIHWGFAADLGFFLVGARSGYSRWVTSQWWFGSTLASRTLCGISAPPDRAKRVFAGW